jgi:hypothetical protein
MRRLLYTAAALCLVPVLGLGLAVGGEVKGGAVKKPLPKPIVKEEGDTCGKYGTTIEFVDTPTEAARKAKKEEKLVFVLHVSGNFEDPRFL